MNNINHQRLLSCSVQQGMNSLKQSGSTDFKPVLFLQALETIMKTIGPTLSEKTEYNINRLYSEVMYKENTICNTPSSSSFIYGRNQCESPIYIPLTLNRNPQIQDPPILNLDDL